MTSIINRLEKKLSEYVGCRYCICTGSGTMALTIALLSLNLPRNSEVIVPSISCHSVPFAVSYANLKPIFCDVNIEDYNININAIDDVITKKTKVIIPIHLFGYPAQMDEIIRYAKDHSLIVIEDAAQAFSGTYKNKKLGSVGNISIVSFGYAKIIDVGGGGAIFTDDYELARDIRKINEGWKEYFNIFAKYSQKAYNLFFKAVNTLGARNINILRMTPYIAPPLFREMSFHKMEIEWANDIINKMNYIYNITQARAKNAELYKKLITAPSIIHPKYKTGDGTYFRYSCLLKDNQRKEFIRELNKRGIWVSALYPALHRIYHSKPELYNASYVESRIFNLIVDPSYSEDRIKKVATTVNEVAEKFLK